MKESYKKLLEQRQTSLEGKYALCICNEDFEQAYFTLGEMMKYGVIDKEDTRLKKTAVLTKKLGTPPTLEWDYRRQPFIPLNVLVDTPRVARLTLTSEEHCSKRIEGNYSGDIIVAERSLPVVIRLCTMAGDVRRELDAFAERYAKYTKHKLDTSDIERELISGERKMYKVEVEDGTSVTMRKLGSILVTPIGPGEPVKLLILMSHKALKSNWIKMDVAYKEVAKILRQALTSRPEQESLVINTLTICKYADIVKEQADINHIREIDVKALKEQKENAEVIIPGRGRGRKKKAESVPEGATEKKKEGSEV